MSAVSDKEIPYSASLLPENSAYVVLMDMREDTWRQLYQFSLFEQLQASGQIAVDAVGLPYFPVTLDYEAEIAPWVGETTAIALLPLEVPRITVFEEHEVLIAPIEDPEAFSGFIDAVAEARGEDPQLQIYQAVDILYWEPEFLEEDSELPPWQQEPAAPSPSEESVAPDANQSKAVPEDEEINLSLPEAPIPVVQGLAIAVFPDFLVAAPNPTAIQNWVDVRPDSVEASLAGNDRFLRTLAHPNYDESLLALYGSVAEMLKYSLADFSFPNLPFEFPLPDTVPPQEIVQLAALQFDSSIEVLIYPQTRGIRMQGRGYFDNSLLALLPSAMQPAPKDVLNHVPGDSFAVLSGQNLSAAWQELKAFLESTEETQGFLDQARGLVSLATGLDLDEDVFGWMDRGFSVFLFPTEETPLTTFFPGLDIGLGLALQTSDRATAEATFETLDERLGAGLITVQPTTFNGRPVTGWSSFLDFDDQPDSFLGRGWAAEDTVVVTTSLGSIREVLSLEPAQALPNAFRFAESTRDFPAETQGYLYANTAPMRSLIARLVPLQSEDPAYPDFLTLMASMQALSGTLSYSDEYIQVDGLLMLAPAGE